MQVVIIINLVFIPVVQFQVPIKNALVALVLIKHIYFNCMLKNVIIYLFII